MPLQLPPGGGTPPAPPPGFPGGAGGGTGAATAPSPMAGSAVQGLTAVKTAIESLQKALPILPLGSPLHSDVLKAVTQLAKHMDAQGGGGDQQAMIQQLMQGARGQMQNPQAQAMARNFPGAGAPPPMPGGGGGGAPPPM